MTLETIWRKIQPASKEQPCPRRYHTAVAVKDQMVVFGGISSGKDKAPLNDLWSFNMSTKLWTKLTIKENLPDPRSCHSCTLIDDGTQMLLFGGVNALGQPLSDTWLFRFQDNVWTQIQSEQNPQARYHHSALFLQDLGCVIVVGGSVDSKNFVQEVVVFEVKAQQWRQLPCNKKSIFNRAGHAMFMGQDGHLHVFGGYQGDGGFDALTDSHKFAITRDDLEWVDSYQVQGTLPYTNRPLCLVHNDQKMYSFGGYDGKATNNDFLQLSIKEGRWQHVDLLMEMDIASIAASAQNNALTKPVARYGHSLVIVGESLVLFGGSGSLYLNDVVQIDLP